MITKLVRFILILFIFSVLTILTQVGGIVFLLSIWLARKTKWNSIVLFIAAYSLVTFLMIPVVAPLFGREKVINAENIRPVNYLTVVLNRNYVTPELNLVLQALSNHPDLIKNSIQARYLDACFPFYNGFPLLPHLSHNDGKKIDFSLVYEDEKGTVVNKSKSFSGYGVFEEPFDNEFNQTNYCKERGFFHYDFPKYLTLGKINSNLTFSERGTNLLLESILDNENVGKIFIEPHLKQRMGITNNRVRFQGCKAVRHDDHIHIQLK